MKELLINGMHCDACKSLISMELEEAGLAECISSIELKENNQGLLRLVEGASDETIAAVSGAINKMDNYSVL